MRIDISYHKVQIVNHPGGWCSLKVLNSRGSLLIGNILNTGSIQYNVSDERDSDKESYITFSSLEGKTFLLRENKSKAFFTLYRHWLNNLLSKEKSI